ncbi:MAG: hypothetical protein ABJD68_05025 [Nakamurella sp.]
MSHPDPGAGALRGWVRHYRRVVLAAFCAAALAAALIIVVVTSGGHSKDSVTEVGAQQLPPSNLPTGGTGPYIPSAASVTDLTDLTHSPTTSTAPITSTGSAGTGPQVLTNPGAFGAPTNITDIAQENGRFPYSLSTINRASPQQVAWAYITLRYTVTWTDTDPQQANARAAAYTTTPEPPPRVSVTTPTQWQAAADAQWQHAVAAHVMSTVQITALTVQLGSAAPGSFTLVTVSWVTKTRRNDQPTITVPGTGTLNLIAQADGTWLVAATGSDQPG